MRLCRRPLLLAAALAQATAFTQTSVEQFLREVSELPLPPSRSAADPGAGGKIGFELRRLISTAAASRGDRSLAPEQTAPVVVRVARLTDVAAVARAIRVSSGEVEADFQHTIWARVRTGDVALLAALAGVRSIEVQPRYEIPYEPVSAAGMRVMAPLGDGVRSAHLDRLHARGIVGKGVRIGILDRGFGGYSRLVREGKVKGASGQRAFPPSYGVENGEIHGSECAEVLTLGAPEADLYLASFDGDEGHLVQAAQWLMDQGVRIVNYSGGNYVNPNDGTDPLSAFVDDSTLRRNVLWVVSAGNNGLQHWSGLVNNGKGDGVLETTPAAPNGFVVTPRVSPVRIAVRWTGPADIEACLYVRRGRALRDAGSSAPIRSGPDSRRAATIELRGPDIVGENFYLVLKSKRALTGSVRVHVFVDSGGASLHPASPAGSILNPASARMALAVGAFDVTTGELAEYSAHGLTDDDRLKPDVTAPSNTVSRVSPVDGRFAGTSASSPHAAALAALLGQLNPVMPASALRLEVMNLAIPKGKRTPNSEYGYGAIDAARAVPAPRRDLRLETTLGITVDVPQAFGNQVAVRTLEELRTRALQASDGLQARVVTDRDLYRVGDAMRIGMRATGDCRCLLFVRHAAGSYQLLPVETGFAIDLRAGEARVFPEASGVIQAGEPFGAEELLLICMEHPGPLGPGAAAASHLYVVSGPLL